ncbi:MAG: hypothetical protein Q8865_08910 [Bacillota bacterium]|nr:hypothetical protein [Bacillota bacterium]
MLKKFILIFIIIMEAVGLSACNNNYDKNNSTSAITEPSPNAANIQKQKQPSEPTNKDSQKSAQKPAEKILFQNSKCGYKLELPKNWEGHYKIESLNSNDSVISVNFYGKSKAGRDLINSKKGLLIFMILKEADLADNPFLDSVQKIGEVNGVSYYYATKTDYPFGSLDNIIKSPDTYYNDSGYKIDATELSLVKNDWEKAKSLEKDVDEIIKTFGSIK